MMMIIIKSLFLFLLFLITNTIEQCVFDACSCEANSTTLDLVVSCVNLNEFPKRNEEFDGKQRLLRLEIGNDSQLHELPEGRFDGLAIEDVQINNNYIKTIDLNTFKGLSGVRRLNLTNNRIACVNIEEIIYRDSFDAVDVKFHSEIFDPLSGELRELDLNQNCFGEDLVNQSRLVENLHLLEYLNLNANRIKTVPSLVSLENLKQLYLANNFIVTITNGELTLPANLQVLNLDNNKIDRIEANWFSHLTQLVSLSLRKNQIKSIGESVFMNLKKLEKLDLGKNFIASISSEAFMKLGLLKSLLLDRQKAPIELIGDFAFDRELTKNEKGEFNRLSVNLSLNSIKRISSKAFCASLNAQKSTLINTINLRDATLSSGIDACVFKELYLKDVEFELIPPVDMQDKEATTIMQCDEKQYGCKTSDLDATLLLKRYIDYLNEQRERNQTQVMFKSLSRLFSSLSESIFKTP